MVVLEISGKLARIDRTNHMSYLKMVVNEKKKTALEDEERSLDTHPTCMINSCQ